MIDLVRKIKFVTREEQFLNSFRVMMATNVEVSGHFVNEHKSRHLATFFVFQTFDRRLSDLLSREHTLIGCVVIRV